MDAAGLEKGDPVLVDGVEAGRVVSVRPLGSGAPGDSEVVARLDDRAGAIGPADVVRVRDSGLLGGRFVSVERPGDR